MAQNPTNRTGLDLPASVSHEIMQKTIEGSAVMRLCREERVTGGTGTIIPVILGDPDPAWVAETENKPVSNPTTATKMLQMYKLAVIVPFSKEFTRDFAALYDALVARLPAALGRKFDATVFGGVTAPGSNFDSLASASTVDLKGTSGVYSALVAARTSIASAGYLMNGVALSPQGEGVLLDEKDTTGRPIFINSMQEGTPSNLLGAKTYLTKGAYVASKPSGFNTLGAAGDWTQAVWGSIGNVKVDFSEEATLEISGEQVNMWQRNMIAVRAEIECGFRCNKDAFNLLTETAS